MMNLLEKLMDKDVRRLKQIDANPNPSRLRSNRMGIELDIDKNKVLLEAWRQGKPLLPYFPSTSLARAMGAHSLTLEGVFLQLQDQVEVRKYTQAVRRLGIPEYMCDMFILPNAAAVLGDLPAPSLSVVCPPATCRVWIYHMKGLIEHFGAPKFEIDLPQYYSEESIKYLADQLGELVEFAESRVPGMKYDRDKHLELIEMNRIYVNYCTKDWELKRHVPLPVGSRDSTVGGLSYEPSYFSNPADALEFWRVRTEEIEERAARGVDREEKLRILWGWAPPTYVDPIAILERRGASLVSGLLPPTLFFCGKSTNWGDEKEFGRKLSPFEEEARYFLGSALRGRGREWVEDVMWACQDLKCDAIAYTQFCLHIGSLAKLVTDTAERELGVPTIIFAAKSFDSTFLPPAEFEARLTEFVDMAIAQKERGSGNRA